MRVAALYIGIMVGITGSPVAPAEPAMAAEPAAAPPSSDWHAAVRNFAAEHFKNPAWGYSHSMRDYALARELAASDHATLDDDVLFAAAYLHDMAAFKPWENEKLDHSDVAAGIVDTVLKGTGFPMAKIDAVRGAIRTHMYNGQLRPTRGAYHPVISARPDGSDRSNTPLRRAPRRRY
jgi:hypothetical protein